MKFNKILMAAVAGTVMLGFSACDSDDPDFNISVITQSNTEPNDLDKWLMANYNEPYNIEFKYRYEDNETDLNFYMVPCRYEDANVMAHMLKYLCVDAYNEEAGTDFTCRYFPKMFFCSGEWKYQNNGTIILATAEGGKKICLNGLNFLPQYMQSMESLNRYYFKTIHHEFTHILNQTHAIPVAFQTVTGNDYISDMWSKTPYNTGFEARGFLSDYAQHSYQEDFAECLSIYLTVTDDELAAKLARAGNNGASLIMQKLDIVRDYMLTTFDIDIDRLRATVQRRQGDIAKGIVDLTDLTVK